MSKTQYSHFVICKVWILGFTHHFTLHPLIWQIFSLISWLYFSTMWILWGRKSLVFDSWFERFFSICDVENTILTYPPHSILSLFVSPGLGRCWCLTHPPTKLFVPSVGEGCISRSSARSMWSSHTHLCDSRAIQGHVSSSPFQFHGVGSPPPVP